MRPARAVDEVFERHEHLSRPDKHAVENPEPQARAGLTLGGLSLVVAAMLTICVGTTYAGAAGGAGNTTTTTTERVPTEATTGVAREYDFGGLYETEPSAGCQVTIDWGDGESSPATLTAAEGGGTLVNGTHTYAAQGEYEAAATATPEEKCHLATTVTVTNITVRDVTLGTNTNYNATIFAVTVSDPAPTPPSTPPPTKTPESTTSSTTSSTTPTSTTSTSATSSPQPTGQTLQAPLVEPPASLCGRSNLFDLIDVYPQAGRAHLVGYADPRLAGQTVRIVSTWNHRVTVTTTVGANGYFRATASLPPKRVQGTNKARYEAQDGSYHSSALKLTRRMYLYTLAPASSGMVKITGVVLPPLTRPVSTISVYRRDNCAQPGYAHVRASVSLNRRTGRFTVLAPAAPAGATGAVYRLSTTVRGSTGTGADETFTLPRTLIGE